MRDLGLTEAEERVLSGGAAPGCPVCEDAIASLRARINEAEEAQCEITRLRKAAYFEIPLPRGLRWLSRFSA